MTGAASARLSRTSLPSLLMAVAVCASGAMLLIVNTRLSFFLDEWDLLLHRRGFSADTFFTPHNEHIIVGPTAIYKAIQATFGMESADPYQVAGIAFFCAAAVVLFVWLRRRVDEWLALFGAVAILFLGTAWEDLLSAFQMGFFGSTAFGLGALLAIERRTKAADALACVLLTLSVSFSSVGLPFLVGAAVAIAVERGPVRRAYVVAAPALLFALWWLGWGHEGNPRTSFEAVATAPVYALDGISSSFTALFGLAPADTAGFLSQPAWGRLLLLAALAAAVWRVSSMREVPRSLWSVLAVGASFWLLAAVNAAMIRSPAQPRYMYVGAIVLVLIAGELLRGIRPPRWALATLAVVGVASIASNLVTLHEGYLVFKTTADEERAAVTALELARDTVDPALVLTEEDADVQFLRLVDAGPYLSAIDAFGSPAYSETELRTAPDGIRRVADKSLAVALPLGLDRSPGNVGVAGPAPDVVFGEAVPVAGLAGCVRIHPIGAGAAAVLPPGGALVEAGADAATVRMRRYTADSFPVRLGEVPASSSALIRIPADRGSQPWVLQLLTAEPVTVCGGAA